MPQEITKSPSPQGLGDFIYFWPHPQLQPLQLPLQVLASGQPMHLVPLFFAL